VSPTSTARRQQTIRKIALCASALVVAVLPTACGAAYADSDESRTGNSSEIKEVGGVDAAESESADDNADEGGEGGEAEGEGEGEADGQDEGAEPAAEEDAGNDGDNQNNGNGQGGGNNGNGNDGDNQNNGNGQGGGNNGNGNGNEGDNNGLDVLGRDCSNSELEPHDGFEEGPRCVDTAFGEVGSADKNPSLLISESPNTVKADEEFTLKVSTRNLVRDRFLGAADGGYYLESSFLDGEGIQRGHFHTACRMLESTDTAPDPAPEPEFFVATQDNGGGAGPDTVDVTVSGISERGTAQCAVWAGDGSHRLPMMQRANQIPAFDIVRITVE
jgi:hypothetical protein